MGKTTWSFAWIVEAFTIRIAPVPIADVIIGTRDGAWGYRTDLPGSPRAPRESVAIQTGHGTCSLFLFTKGSSPGVLGDERNLRSKIRFGAYEIERVRRALA
jgi:hypothetical protein